MSSIDVREMALKCTTKSEVYKVLTITGGIYLPPADQINWDFIRDLLFDDKLLYPFSSPLKYMSESWIKTSLKYIEGNRVKIIESPHIEWLCVTDLLQFESNQWNIRRYMPEYECEKYPSQKWIWNISKMLDGIF